MALRLSALRRIFTSHEKSLLQLILHDGRIGVYLHLVPSLLQEISAIIVSAVSITESNVFDIIAHQWANAGREIIYGVTQLQWMLAYNDVHQHGLASPIPAYYGYMLMIAYPQIDRLRHAPFRHACNSILYGDDISHFYSQLPLTRFLFLSTKSFHPE